jgi:nicotinamide phosphoribosyltransferase
MALTRDTHGFAMKSTNAVINGVQTPIFKDPKTDNGTKKSAKGLLMVTQDVNGYHLEDMVDTKAEQRGCLETVFKDGVLIKTTTLAEIREITSRI